MPSSAAAKTSSSFARRSALARLRPTTVPRPQSPRLVAVAMADGPERDGIVARLRELGWSVLTASDGSGALHLLNQRQPALILLDLWLPQINGLDVLRQAERPTPAILISEFCSPAVRFSAAAAGALSFWLQSINLEALIAQAHYILTQPLADQRIAEETHDSSRIGHQVEPDPGDARVGWADRASQLRGIARYGAHARRP